MKLKEAKKIAKELGFKFVAVDESLSIYCYKYNKGRSYRQWNAIDGDGCVSHCIGQYTGSKHWAKTMREVK